MLPCLWIGCYLLNPSQLGKAPRLEYEDGDLYYTHVGMPVLLDGIILPLGMTAHDGLGSK